MSRGGAVKTVLGVPSAAVVSVKPSGDCFYECVTQAFSSAGHDVTQMQGVFSGDGDDGAMALRCIANLAFTHNCLDL